MDNSKCGLCDKPRRSPVSAFCSEHFAEFLASPGAEFASDWLDRKRAEMVAAEPPWTQEAANALAREMLPGWLFDKGDALPPDWGTVSSPCAPMAIYVEVSINWSGRDRHTLTAACTEAMRLYRARTKDSPADSQGHGNEHQIHPRPLVPGRQGSDERLRVGQPTVGARPAGDDAAGGSEIRLTAETAHSFWGRVAQRGDTECWSWTGSLTHNGYGTLCFDGGTKRAHRVAWQLSQGAIPLGMHVLHRCDNPPCCNPRHLFLGTHDDNMADRAAKGRDRRGTEQPAAKLTDANVRVIRAEYRYGNGRKLAERFGVSAQTISRIVNGEDWSHVDAGVIHVPCAECRAPLRPEQIAGGLGMGIPDGVTLCRYCAIRGVADGTARTNAAIAAMDSRIAGVLRAALPEPPRHPSDWSVVYNPSWES